MTQPPLGEWNPEQPGSRTAHDAQHSVGQWPPAPGDVPLGPGQHGPPGFPQQPWPSPPPPAPRGGSGGGKWVVATVVLLVIVAVVVVGVAIWTGRRGGDGAAHVAASRSDASASESSTTRTATVLPPEEVTPGLDTTVIASVNDGGPVSFISDDPTCAHWAKVAGDLTNRQGNGWTDRQFNVPADQWSPEEKKSYDEVGQAYRHAGDRAVGLARLTPHRVMREMYEQFTAFSRAYADSIPTYNGVQDEFLTNTAAAFENALNGVCDGVNYGDAKTHPPQVPAAAGPSQVAQLDDPARPTRAMPTINGQCGPWRQAYKDLIADPVYTAWANEGMGQSATQWSDQKKKANQDIIPVFAHYYDTIENLGRRSGDPLMEDMGGLAQLYGRAFNAAIPTYTSSDTALHDAAWQSVLAINSACGVAGAP